VIDLQQLGSYFSSQAIQFGACRFFVSFCFFQASKDFTKERAQVTPSRVLAEPFFFVPAGVPV
jgi:hypothetical protein